MSSACQDDVGSSPKILGRQTEKQIIRVLDAVCMGCETSRDVSEFTGLSLPHCSAYLTELYRDGRIRLHIRNSRALNGRPQHRYAPIGAGT